MLTAGQKAIHFSLKNKDNKLISLSDFTGQKVVIYFYPKDDTPGCTRQACAFRDAYDGFVNNKVAVIGISRDTTASHQAFAEKYHLPFILLADLDGAVISSYDVKGPFGAARTTYVIDEQGMIEKVFADASPDTNAADILSYLNVQKKNGFQISMENRRSYYAIEKKSPIPDSRIMELVTFAVRHSPSAMNSQSQMVAVLLGKNHDRLWDIVLETLRKIVPAEHFPSTQEKIQGFQAGYGTILFFNDENITKSLQESLPLYAEKFPEWAQHANGMLQFAVWNLLEEQGFGASLQHYNPLIDAELQSKFNIPKNWRLIAQMPFGNPTAQPDVKEFADTASRIIQL